MASVDVAKNIRLTPVERSDDPIGGEQKRCKERQAVSDKQAQLLPCSTACGKEDEDERVDNGRDQEEMRRQDADHRQDKCQSPQFFLASTREIGACREDE